MYSVEWHIAAAVKHRDIIAPQPPDVRLEPFRQPRGTYGWRVASVISNKLLRLQKATTHSGLAEKRGVENTIESGKVGSGG